MGHAGSLAAHVAAFAVSLGPIAWLITSEIHPLNVCGTALGVVTLSDWTVDLIVAMTFLPLRARSPPPLSGAAVV